MDIGLVFNSQGRLFSDDEMRARRAEANRRAYHTSVDYYRKRGKEKSARLRAGNPEKYRIKSTTFSRKFRIENPGYHAIASLKFRTKHPERVKAQVKASNKAHPETQKAATHRKRARKKNARGAGMTRLQWLEIIEEQEGCCAMCDQWFGNKLTPDHVVPLTKDGMHDVSNILGVCVRCNSTKWHHWPIVKNFQPWARPVVRATIKWHLANPLPPAV